MMSFAMARLFAARNNVKLATFKNGWWWPTVTSESHLMEPCDTQELASSATIAAILENKKGK